MSPIKKLLCKLFVYIWALITILVFISVIIIILIPPQFEDTFENAIQIKYDYLVDTKESPKVIIIGDSNSSFGIDSEYLSNLIQLPVVHLGLEGGMGFDFLFNMAKENVNEGDIVLASYIPGTIQQDLEATRLPELIEIAVDGRAGLYRYVSLKDYPNFIYGFPAYFCKKIDRFIQGDDRERDTGTYSSDSFNNKGNMILKRDSCVFDEEYPEEWNGVTYSVVNQDIINKLNHYGEDLEARGGGIIINICICYGFDGRFNIFRDARI